MSRLPGDWAPPYPKGLDRIHEQLSRPRPRRDQVEIMNVKQIQIEEADWVYSIKAPLSGTGESISFERAPGRLIFQVGGVPATPTASAPSTSIVAVPENVSIAEPSWSIEDGSLVVHLRKTRRSAGDPSGTTGTTLNAADSGMLDSSV